jgi:hypothetical protein
MAITVADNFSYQGKKPLDGRDTFATLAAMKAYAEASVYDGCLSYCDEDGKRYEFKSTNTVDPTTGKWREYSSGGGGQTYNDFTGATASTAGAHGLVPAPSAGDEGKVLFGNGAWGALPSVDLSSLSAEAFILDTNEKAIGMTSNRKLLYQRYVEKTTPNSSSLVSLFSEQNLENCYFAGGYFVDANGYDVPINRYEDGVTDVGVSIKSNGTQMYFGVGSGSSGRPARFIIRYTKTTDSPLPSGVKFAGVTASGEVILKKDYDLGQELVIGSDKNDVASWTDTGISDPGVGKIIDVKCNGNSGSLFPMSAAIISNKLNLTSPASSHKVRYITLYYTLAS